ncbi:MAG: hypothetical protein Q9159_000346 [Coniocarpon cinnabarinum]
MNLNAAPQALPPVNGADHAFVAHTGYAQSPMLPLPTQAPLNHQLVVNTHFSSAPGSDNLILSATMPPTAPPVAAAGLSPPDMGSLPYPQYSIPGFDAYHHLRQASDSKSSSNPSRGPSALAAQPSAGTGKQALTVQTDSSNPSGGVPEPRPNTYELSADSPAVPKQTDKKDKPTKEQKKDHSSST